MTTRPHGLSRYKNGPDEHGTCGKGCRCPACSQANRDYQDRRSRLIAYGQWDGQPDAAGTRRRIEALMRCGWSLGLLSARLGQSRQSLRAKLHRGRVTAATARAVAALYDDLWDKPPPAGTRFERRAATMARAYAEERGFPFPAAWDDDEIDDPAATPVDGWDRGDDGKREHGTLTAEALELIGFGLDEKQAAERLGVSAGTLSVTLARARGRTAVARPAVQTPSGSPAVAAAIREARRAAGMTQRRLAAVVGVTEVCIQLWERAERTPGAGTWQQLELTLGPLGIVRGASPAPVTAEAERRGEAA